MNLCPLLIVANRSFASNDKIREESIYCEGQDCSWYDQTKEKCKLINSIYKNEYIMKSFNLT